MGCIEEWNLILIFPDTIEIDYKTFKKKNTNKYLKQDGNCEQNPVSICQVKYFLL